MDVKGTLKALTLEFRRELEGKYDAQGTWQAGDLERRLAAIGVRRDRAPVPVDELPHLAPADREARRLVDAFLQSRAEAGQNREAAIAEFVRDAAYTWANRLLALRCMEARALIDEVILQKDAYGGRSLQHNRLAKKQPERCVGDDEGLFAALFDEFSRRAEDLPLLFDPRAPEVALRPSVGALKRCVAILSGALAVKGQEPATDEVFAAPDALGWTYQYWNTEEKDRVFENVRTKKGYKIEGAEIVPATCIYTEPYMVKFLVQNSLGVTWMGMHPDSRLFEKWQYYVRDVDRAPVSKKAVSELTFVDPACGSGHFLIEAFELFYAMYVEEGALTDPAQICASILERNLYGIDIDERAAQIAALALVMKAKEKAPNFVPRCVNLVATNIRLPAGKEHLEAFLAKHPEDVPLKPALLAIFEGLAHVDELGSLLQIKEPVERELRHLRDQQIARERKAGAGMLFGPRKDEDWSAWKHEVIERLRQHLSVEAQGADLAAAFFGEAAGKGLSLGGLLARRYDVVAANPPYMGSKNMGAVLKRYVERHFSAGKRDLYAAFILRCLELAAPGGRVAMVMPQSWMFLRSFADLRADGDGARGVLRTTRIETVAQLGRHAFAEADPPSNVVLTTFALSEPPDTHRLTCFRLSAPMPSEGQAMVLRNAVGGSVPSICFRPAQRRFLTIPQAPLCYWFRERFFELFAGPTLGDVTDVCQGLATANDARYVRFTWEPPQEGWGRPMGQRRWVPFEKGGGYGKWFGHHLWTVDWEDCGARIKASPTAVVRNEQHYFKEGWTYSVTARGSLGLRTLTPGVFSGQSAGLVVRVRAEATVAAPANCRLASSLLRGMTAQMYFRESYVARLPLPERLPEVLGALQLACLALKRWHTACDVRERTFAYAPLSGLTLCEANASTATRAEAVAAMLHALEGVSERIVFAEYGVSGEDLLAVLGETGTPAAWFPLVAGYDAVPELSDGLDVAAALIERLAREPRRTMSAGQLADLKRRLRTMYEAGPGPSGEDDDAETESSSEDKDDEGGAVAASGAHIPIPAETFLEELSQKLEMHPFSVYWLLRELREQDAVVCEAELLRFVEDYASVLVLRLLGHRWPRQVEAATPLPEWADKDGIIPITDGASEPTLLVRVRALLEADFGAKRVSAVEREFQEVVGKSLSEWLMADFFKRHISQFKKRPIIWQIESTPSGNGRRQSRRAARKASAFSCLVYYHCLNADLLPKLRTQYVGPLRTSFQTELASIEKLKTRSADQDVRRLELEEKLDELKTFDARLEQVIVEGFASAHLDALAGREPIDKWTPRDARAPAPASEDAFLAQERRYAPDLNDGVRVNIAPLQRAGLLAVVVLAGKDLETPIADRAEWRADERRWCREGKLPQPGWWGEAPKEGA